MRDINEKEGTSSPIICRHGSDGIFVWTKDHYHKIPYTEILYLRAFGEKCFIHTRDQEKILAGHCLSKVMTRYKFESLSFHPLDKAVQWFEVDRRVMRKKQEVVSSVSMGINEKDTATYLVCIFGILG